MRRNPSPFGILAIVNRETIGKGLWLGAITALLYGAEAISHPTLAASLGMSSALAGMLGAVLAGAAHLCTHKADQTIRDGAANGKEGTAAARLSAFHTMRTHLQSGHLGWTQIRLIGIMCFVDV